MGSASPSTAGVSPGRGGQPREGVWPQGEEMDPLGGPTRAGRLLTAAPGSVGILVPISVPSACPRTRTGPAQEAGFL